MDAHGKATHDMEIVNSAARKASDLEWKSLPPTRAAQFDLDKYGVKTDDINLWYVAVTRAKKRLSLPPAFVELVDACRDVHDFNKTSEPDASHIPRGSQAFEPPDSPARRDPENLTIELSCGLQMTFCPTEVELIYWDLVWPMLGMLRLVDDKCQAPPAKRPRAS